MDFEIRAIQAAKNIFGHEIIIRGCLYHLYQSTLRKIQELGYKNLYRYDENFSHFCAMINGLLFFPLHKVKEGMMYFKNLESSTEAKEILDYFDSVYVSGKLKRIGSNDMLRFRRVSPLFPPNIWNVYEATLQGQNRTNNQCEGWNNRFSNLIGNVLIYIYRIIMNY